MIQFITHIRAGRVSNPQVFKKYIGQMPDGSYMVKFESNKKRSNNQNEYYWGCVIPLMQEGLKDAGWDELNTTMKVHEFLIDLFLKKEIVNHKTGEVKQIRVGSSELTTTEFNEYISTLQQYAAEYLSTYVPDPNEKLELWK